MSGSPHGLCAKALCTAVKNIQMRFTSSVQLPLACHCSSHSVAHSEAEAHWSRNCCPEKGQLCSIGPEQGLRSCTRAMSLMKQARKRKLGAGNKAPKKRQGFPEVDQTKLEDKLDDYIRSLGVAQSFNMFEYNNLQSQQAHVPSAIFKLHGLLEALLTASPTSQIKYRNLRDALESMVQKYGHELLSQHWTLEKHLLTGRAADSITVLLNHWRRCVASDTQWSKFISKLSHAQANVLTRLRKMTTSAPATCSKKVLKEHKSDVTMDSEGFPTMLQDEETSLELVHGEDETSDEPCCSIDEAAALREPPPVLKKDWKDAAGKPATKKPASRKAKAKAGPCKRDCKDAKGIVKIHQPSLCTGGGRVQSYIQHVPPPNKNKRLVAAVTQKQASHTTKSHKQLVMMLMEACKKPGASKQSVLEFREELFKKHAKK